MDGLRYWAVRRALGRHAENKTQAAAELRITTDTLNRILRDGPDGDGG